MARDVVVYEFVEGRSLEHYISHLNGLVADIRTTGRKIKSKASANLAHHKDAGNMSISIAYGKTDVEISLNDPPGASAKGKEGGGAAGFEFGHFNKRARRHIPGAYVLYGAAGLS